MSTASGRDLPFAAIVLAGGGGRRLGGVDKASLDLAGVTLLERALTAVADAWTVVVVGPARDVPERVLSIQEEPAGGGPVAGLAAGLSVLPDNTDDHGLVVVLACDMPFVDATVVTRLVAAAADGAGSADEGSALDGAALVDRDGRPQHLAAAYRSDALRAAIGALGRVDGSAMRDVAKRLTVVEIEADPETTLDCDTWSDVRRTRRVMEER